MLRTFLKVIFPLQVVRFSKNFGQKHGIKNTFDPEKVLLEQIEDSNAEVFYNLDPSGLNPALLRKLRKYKEIGCLASGAVLR